MPSVSDDDSVVEEEQSLQSQSQTPPGAVVPAADEAPAEQEVRPWNLRRGERRLVEVESNFRESECDCAKSPRLRGDKRDREEKEKERVVRRSKRISWRCWAIDLLVRPKKRPRIVQKQMDALFPGLWLSEVTVDNYKVPEFAGERKGSNASGGLLRGSNFKASFADYYAYILLFVVDQLQFRLALSLDGQWGPPFSLGSEAVVPFLIGK
ncbi:hypothetical protein NC653_026630 [Populus alba x Populus x berolinensis]|uniref:Uncharacterized protein n=1 Tax=Populus alba x Populus x berolinensis TaxID=444605 RepID=A0AAD6QAI7_9ROSI|nr:hypothetical protein NC653_026630 [Populus alba x Populus x berolinensis]